MNASDRQRKLMLETPIPRLITSLALPAIVVYITAVIYNSVDTYFISQINKSASAAVGAAFAVTFVINAFGFGLGKGAGTICAIKLGQRKNDEASKTASSALMGSIIAGLVLSALGLTFLSPLMKMIGCSDSMLEYAKQYTFFILLAAPLFSSHAVILSCLRAEGKNNLVMIGALTGGIVNLALDPLLIFYFNFGVRGAAVATVISQLINLVICLQFYVTGKASIQLRFKFISKKFSTYFEIVTVGLPTVCKESVAAIATILLNKQAVTYGDAAVAAINISNKIYFFIRFLIYGLGEGFQPVAGYNYGAHKFDRTKIAFLFTTFVGTIICLSYALMTSLLRDQIMWWFINDKEVVAYGRQILLFLSISAPFLAFSTLVNQIYQCLGFKKQATFLALCRQGIFFVPVILLAPTFIGIVGVEISQSVADICTALVSVPFIIAMFRKHLPTH